MSENVIERETGDTFPGDAPEPMQQSHAAGNLGWVCPVREGQRSVGTDVPVRPAVIPQIIC
jgi:hypothetical protein